MKHLPKKEPAASTAGQATQKVSEPTSLSSKRQATDSGLLKEIGPVRLVKLENGRFCVLYPEQGGSEFTTLIEARECFQAVARREKGYSSGFDPCARQSAPGPNARGQGEAFNARSVRRLVRDDVPLADFLDCCLVEMPKLLKWIDQVKGDPEEKVRIKQRLLRWQARARLEGA
jgi:hypothetical protein